MDEDDLREQAVWRLKQKRKFVDDVVGYVAVNGVLWLIWLLTGHSSDGGVPWPVWVSAIWGFLLLIDAWKLFGLWPSARGPISEGEIDREIKRVHRAR